MPSLLRTVTSSAAALACVALATATPVQAGGYRWPAYDYWQSNWRAAYLSGGWDGVIRTGSPDPRLGQAVLGEYPYHAYGYNNGSCFGYEWVCDPWGNVIGRRPVLIC